MVVALSKICEIVAYLDIAILAALGAIYAIVVNFLSRLVKRTKEESDRKIAEAKLFAELKKKEIGDAISRTEDKVDASKTEKQLAESWLESLDKIDKFELDRTARIDKLTFGSVFGKPALYLIISLLFVMLSYLFLNVINDYKQRYIFSICFFLLCLLFLSICLFKFVIPRLRDINMLAQEDKETSLEDILREQMQQTRKDQIVKLDEVIKELRRLYSLKIAAFNISFLLNERRNNKLTLKTNEEKTIALILDNNSDFPIRDGNIGMALPQEFTLRRNDKENPIYRPAYSELYPRGAKLVMDLNVLMPSYSDISLSFMIKGSRKGNFKFYIWVNSTSHERYETILKIKVE